MAVAAAMMTMCGLAGAQDLAQRDKFDQDKVQLAQYAKRVNQACGTQIRFSINYQSYAGKSDPSVRMQSPTEYLMNAGDAIINICVTPAGKAAVAQKIHEVHGALGAGEEYTLAGGVFTYKTSYKGGSVTAPEKYLKSVL
jgi:hypothetical protein